MVMKFGGYGLSAANSKLRQIQPTRRRQAGEVVLLYGIQVQRPRRPGKAGSYGITIEFGFARHRKSAFKSP
jgi:hypothetical protein